jgi:hypothetical protein
MDDAIHCSLVRVGIFCVALLVSYLLALLGTLVAWHLAIEATPGDEEAFATRFARAAALALGLVSMDWILAYALGYGLLFFTPSGWPVPGHLLAPLVTNRVTLGALVALWHVVLTAVLLKFPTLRVKVKYVSEAQATLGLATGALSTKKAVKKAFHKKVRTCHPDKPGGSAEAYRAVEAARVVLLAVCDVQQSRLKFAGTLLSLLALTALDWYFSGLLWRTPWWALLAMPLLALVHPALALAALLAPLLTAWVLTPVAVLAWAIALHIALHLALGKVVRWWCCSPLNLKPFLPVCAFAVVLVASVADYFWTGGYIWVEGSSWARVPFTSLIAPSYAFLRFAAIFLAFVVSIASGAWPDTLNADAEDEEETDKAKMLRARSFLDALFIAAGLVSFEVVVGWLHGTEAPTFGLQSSGVGWCASATPRAWWARHVAGWLLLPAVIALPDAVSCWVVRLAVLTMHFGAIPDSAAPGLYALLQLVAACVSGFVWGEYSQEETAAKSPTALRIGFAGSAFFAACSYRRFAQHAHCFLASLALASLYWQNPSRVHMRKNWVTRMKDDKRTVMGRFSFCWPSAASSADESPPSPQNEPSLTPEPHRGDGDDDDDYEGMPALEPYAFECTRPAREPAPFDPYGAEELD